MPSGPADPILNLHRALDVTRPPERITQVPFDADQRHLRRLAGLRPGDRPDPADLWAYTQDILYQSPVQSDLFIYGVPFLLRAWRDDLRGFDEGYGGVVEHLYPILANHELLAKCLAPKQLEVISQFLQHTIVEEMDEQRGLAYQGVQSRPHKWFRAFTTYGVLRPDVDHLWHSWAPVETVGRAVSAVQYVSCLMYQEYENPVFAPWTSDRGGGPPCLWEFEGHLYSHRWMEPNVVFLRTVLMPQIVEDLLARAVKRLVGEPEFDLASAVEADFALVETTVARRCTELPRFLETVQQSTTDFHWPAD